MNGAIDRDAFAAAIERDGFALRADVVDDATITAVLAACQSAAEHTIARQGRVYARRNLLELAEVRRLAESQSLRPLVETVLGPSACVVRALLFDKVPGANWHVGWHQDLIIPVQERTDVPGFGPWTVKAGQPHVKPPTEVLTKMLTLRVHLDDAPLENGPLKLIPGSHRHGELEANEVKQRIEERLPFVAACARGSVLAMRPLTLHASSPADQVSHRRVLHLEYAGGALPSGLRWASGEPFSP